MATFNYISILEDIRNQQQTTFAKLSQISTKRLEEMRDLTQNELVEQSTNTTKRLEDLHEIIQKEFADKMSGVTCELELLKTEHEALKKAHEILIEDKKRLESQIATLQEEHRNFTKVSKLIALENENCRLKNEVALLMQGRRNKVPDKKPPESQIPDETDKPPEKQFQVKEKKIGKTVYYVDDADNVYDKQENDEVVGNQVGRLKKENGKTKIVWFK